MLGRNSEADIEKGHVDKDKDKGGMIWETSIDIYTLPCVKQTALLQVL